MNKSLLLSLGLIFSLPVQAGYITFTGADGRGLGFETDPANLVQCHGGKYDLCYEGDMNVTVIRENGETTRYVVADSQFYFSDKKAHYQAEFSPTDPQYSYIETIDFNLDLNKKGDGSFDAKLDLEIDGYHPEFGEIDFKKKFHIDDIAGEWALQPPSQVPVPTTAFLFGSALAFLGLVARNRRQPVKLGGKEL